MPDRSIIDAFLAQRHLAVVGVSRDSRAFANQVYRKLREGDRTLYPVNAAIDPGVWLEDDLAYRSVLDLPEQVDSVMLVVPRDQLHGLLVEAAARGIRRVWIHRGAGQSPVAAEHLTFCDEHGIEVVGGACAFMFDEPVRGIHRLHRIVAGRRIAA